MRALKIATIIMGVLIILGTTGLIIGVARRSASPSSTSVVAVPASPASSAAVSALPASVSAVLDEPIGTRIAGIVAVRDRLAVQLQGGGVDRVVLVDPATGVVSGRISLAR
jgi:hypothetical protein